MATKRMEELKLRLRYIVQFGGDVEDNYLETLDNPKLRWRSLEF